MAGQAATGGRQVDAPTPDPTPDAVGDLPQPTPRAARHSPPLPPLARASSGRGAPNDPSADSMRPVYSSRLSKADSLAPQSPFWGVNSSAGLRLRHSEGVSQRLESPTVFRDMMLAPRVLPWYQWMPGICLMYDFLFDEVPHFDNLEKMLNTLGLLDALLLAITMSVPGCVSYNELEEANARWSDEEEFAHLVRQFKRFPRDGLTDWESTGGMVSSRLSATYSLATGFLSSGLLALLSTYFFSSSSIYRSDESFAAWWVFGRWGILFILACTIVGAWETFSTFLILNEIKFPDNHFGEVGLRLGDTKSPLSVALAIQAGILYATVVLMFVLLSGACTMRYLEEHRDLVAEGRQEGGGGGRARLAGVGAMGAARGAVHPAGTSGGGDGDGDGGGGAWGGGGARGAGAAEKARGGGEDPRANGSGGM